MPVLAGDQNGNPVSVANLDAFLGGYFREPVTLPEGDGALCQGRRRGVGRHRVREDGAQDQAGDRDRGRHRDMECDQEVRVSQLNFNNGHNMWANRDQSLIYNTEWFGNRLIAFDRTTGKLVSVLKVGAAPAHVMTRTDTDQVHTRSTARTRSSRLSPGASGIDRRIPLQQAGEPTTHPHAHWMSSDGKQMATPNANSDDSTLINVPNGTITSKLAHGYAADCGRHDARLEQVLRVKLREQHGHRHRHEPLPHAM